MAMVELICLAWLYPLAIALCGSTQTLDPLILPLLRTSVTTPFFGTCFLVYLFAQLFRRKSVLAGGSPLLNPHSSAFVDLNGDCLADLFVTAQDPANPSKPQYEIWINNIYT